ncbi:MULTISPECIES: LPD29 domain-containing protein [Flavobacterium]|uniref:LPD29 domain-containing protein n=1 Tax=Flavobacterium jumunjinense TaxID=998845 RepID=A0ABV5GSM5_9FLAO|nr:MULTISPECIES: LPD29 domain-containing protein [Flavobacterium]
MSKSVEKFHALNGATVSREDLHKIINLAKNENNTTIIYRCTRALEIFPKNEKECIVEIQQYKSALNAPHHSGSYKEALDDCGRLKKGWKFQNGNVIQVKKDTKKSVTTKDKSLKIKEKPVIKKSTDDSKNVQKTQNVAKRKSKYGVKKEKNRVQKVQKTRTFERKSFAPEEWKNADTRKTTYLIKKYLKEKFGIDCRVKSEYYSGGSSLNIWYNFGPAEKVVEDEIKRLQYGSFDGMTDMYNYSDRSEKGMILDGYKLNEYKFVFVSREIPKSFDTRLAILVSSVDKFNNVPPFDGNENKLHDNFPQRFGEFWSWGQLVRSKFWNANYVTQNESEIKDLEIHGNFNDYHLTYTVKGKKYNSRKPSIYPTKMVKEKNIIKNLIRFIDYGKDNVAVIGYTGEISDYLEEEGGEYSNEIKFQGENHSGFIFHKSKADAVANILINYANEDKSAGLSAPSLTGVARTALDFYSKSKKKIKIKSKEVLNGVSVIEEQEAEKPVATNKLMQMQFDSLPINEEWQELMQNPAANLKIAIWGKPKNGKTSASLQMANYFTNFGNVLYNFADQGFNKSTQDLWINSGLADNSNAYPDDSDTIEALEKEIATGKYKFVFIDMISDYIRLEKIKPEDFKKRFIKKYPSVSFILIFEVTKSGDFKGDQGWTHLVDAIMTVEDFLIENRGRYGMGERVVWEEGFKKFNPKRYQEYLENKTTSTTEVIEEEQTENIPGPVTNVPEFSFQIQ